ncbi:MAG: putative holin-like toxin [Eubacterium sp.]|nr:putative holin-like toxin [Eubacterium sp.]
MDTYEVLSLLLLGGNFLIALLAYMIGITNENK